MLQHYERKGYDAKYPEILTKLQEEQTKAYWQVTAEGNSVKSRELIMPFIQKYVESHNISIRNHTSLELCEKLYNDLQGYSILTAPLLDDDVEGIHVNAWNNVRLQLRNGQSVKIDGFNSRQHAVDIIRRMLQESHQTIDDAIPVAEGSIGLGGRVRITALKTPVVDEDVGIACYIRKLNRRVFTEEQYLAGDFADQRELRFLEIALRRGISTLLVGRVNTGKTTFLNYLLSKMPDDMEIITIECGAREINLIKRDENGEIVNNVVHTLTRESKIPEQDITQETLVEKMLRLNPDIGSVAEMRNTEAYAAQEASTSGHVIISTTHAGSPEQAHRRVANLCRKKYPIEYHAALEEACDAFPLVAFIHNLEDNRRRIMKVTECYLEHGEIVYHPIWKYEIEDTVPERAGIKVIGKHIQVDDPSENLLDRMQLYGITKREIEEIKNKKAEKC